MLFLYMLRPLRGLLRRHDLPVLQPDSDFILGAGDAAAAFVRASALPLFLAPAFAFVALRLLVIPLLFVVALINTS